MSSVSVIHNIAHIISEDDRPRKSALANKKHNAICPKQALKDVAYIDKEFSRHTESKVIALLMFGENKHN